VQVPGFIGNLVGLASSPVSGFDLFGGTVREIGQPHHDLAIDRVDGSTSSGFFALLGILGPEPGTERELRQVARTK
jgi:hypothetical protein